MDGIQIDDKSTKVFHYATTYHTKNKVAFYENKSYSITGVAGSCDIL